MAPSVFVCGATGRQGGAVTRQLLAQGATVHALVRDSSSPKSKTLESVGVKLWPGDFDDEETLKNAIRGTKAIFLNFMPVFSNMGANLRQAQSILRIAKEEGAAHVVYSSSFSVDKLDEIEGFDKDSFVGSVLLSKVNIENAVRLSGLNTWTILRPGNFMANYVNPLAQYQIRGLAESGRWSSALRPDTVLSLVDTVTIGIVSAHALLNPKEFDSMELNYADENLTVSDLMGKLSAATGRDLQMVPMSDEEIVERKSSDPFVGGQIIMRAVSKFLDAETYRKLGFPVSTFDKYLEREKDAVRDTYLSTA